MAEKQQPVCISCGSGPCGGKGLVTLKDGAWTTNPLAVQMLGICSALAVTNRLRDLFGACGNEPPGELSGHGSGVNLCVRGF
jgi:hypothetical protein